MLRQLFGKNIVSKYHTQTFKSIYNTVQQQSQQNAQKPLTSLKEINGWIKSIRLFKNICFIDINDGTINSSLKIVIPELVSYENSIKFLKDLKVGQSISIKDLLIQLTPTKAQQPFELKLLNDPTKSINILGGIPAGEDFPLQKKNHTMAFLNSLPTLKFKSNYLNNLLKFRSFVDTQLINFFNKNDFIKTTPPILTSNDCEGGGDLFTIKDSEKYFNKSTYLTVSTQLHLEILALSLNRCFTISPCFRAERSNTTRHLCEFWMLEAELCFTKDLNEVMDLVENMIRSIVNEALKNEQSLLPNYYPGDVLNKEQILERWQSLTNPASWPRITYSDTIRLLLKQHMKEPFTNGIIPSWGMDLSTEHEKWISGKYFQSPVFITDYPKSLKPFYMKQNPPSEFKIQDNQGNIQQTQIQNTVACFDLLVPEIGEIVGGSLREDNYKVLADEMKLRNMNKDSNLDWYLDTRRYGSVPHGGFGLGMERLLTYLYGNTNIREAIPFARSASDNIQL
ncbi:hypothetical protein TBLA_0A01400 [Henningerozyma blattae CBS 6284]|uniref:asparagine--tRNA ligase n=1 Tax=Henningerozyma blattae (strain ATCC 34711 / CBS 6284 / DSM 70876 / NBRC 10599 / NRRL Y-10934 / UCD 77-7) TaxID=1071380 RepID=I2GUY7_HENB6|nr:hypothetical protein TBLA_0A01400 [Tetrapisispora blattae CBS 6284]CCH57939.1 hypothetical protein TBLA_0A01400 [Tetrapisispora blattae CBS 6284]